MKINHQKGSIVFFFLDFMTAIFVIGWMAYYAFQRYIV